MLLLGIIATHCMLMLVDVAHKLTGRYEFGLLVLICDPL